MVDNTKHRFFEKNKAIDTLTDAEINDFLAKENIIGKVEPGRVEDFYNALSNVLAGEDVAEEKDIDFDQFNCKTTEDIAKVQSLKLDEKSFLFRINKDLLGGSRLLRAAAALSYKFEKERYGGREDAVNEDANTYLRKLFMYHEELPEDMKPATFGDLLEIDVNFMKYLALLGSKKAFSRPEGKFVRSETGTISKYSQMESVSEVFSADLLQMVMPDFGRKLATKDLYVRGRYEKQEKSQNMVILLDDSGSMSDFRKKAMVKAALTLKLRDHSDVHNIYIGTFETRIFGFKKIEKGMTFEDLSFIRLRYGTTNVNYCVKNAIEQIKKRSLLAFEGPNYILNDSHFEILVINDGQDHVDRTYHPEIKVHALCLMEKNDDLKNICHRSGGTYHYIPNE